MATCKTKTRPNTVYWCPETGTKGRKHIQVENYLLEGNVSRCTLQNWSTKPHMGTITHGATRSSWNRLMDPATEVRRTFKRRVKGYVMQYVTDTTEILLKLG